MRNNAPTIRQEMRLAQDDRKYRYADVFERFIPLGNGEWIKAVCLHDGDGLVHEWYQDTELAEVQRIAFKRAVIVQFIRKPYRFREAR